MAKGLIFFGAAGVKYRLIPKNKKREPFVAKR